MNETPAPPPVKEARCRHTFLKSLWPCPYGCHGSTKQFESEPDEYVPEERGVLDTRPIDLTNKKLAGVIGLRRAGRIGSNLAWAVRFPACGHERVFASNYLRQVHAACKVVHCPVCKTEKKQGGS